MSSATYKRCVLWCGSTLRASWTFVTRVLQKKKVPSKATPRECTTSEQEKRGDKTIIAKILQDGSVLKVVKLLFYASKLLLHYI